MARAPRPLMVEVAQTGPELLNGRCTDCKTPLSLMHGRAFRGVTADGNFLIEALCMKCVDRERWIVTHGVSLPAPRIYRRRLAVTLQNTALAAAGYGTVATFLTVLGYGADWLTVSAAAAWPLALLFIPGTILYRQGCTQSKTVSSTRAL